MTSLSTLSLGLTLTRTNPPAGTVRVVNEGQGSVRIWASGNSWGDAALSFVISGLQGEVHLVRSDQVYTRNFPGAEAVAPGQGVTIAFDLGDGTWSPPRPAKGRRLSARFAIPVSDEAKAQDVWTGTIVSDPVALSED
jgi:hypothetical protein